MSDDAFLGLTLGKFRIEGKLGEGGMGAVYKARQIDLDRPAAVKVLPAHLAVRKEFVERFLREARKLAQLTHGNIVQVFDFGTDAGHSYIAMQFMDGGSLQDLLAEKVKLPPREAARIVRDAARGLARAHKAGIIHRDIKPANILLGKAGDVRLGDFGLVKDLTGADAPLTATGVILGTPHYMAPEQCEGLPEVDHRVDIYALGLVLYQCLSSVLPVKGVTPLQIIRARLEEDPLPLREVAPDLPPVLCQLVDEMLVRDRDRRLSSAAAVADRLDRYLLGATPDPRTLAQPLDDDVPVLPSAREGVVPTARLVSYHGPGDEPQTLPDSGRQRRAASAHAKAESKGSGSATNAAILVCGCLGLGFFAFILLAMIAGAAQ